MSKEYKSKSGYTDKSSYYSTSPIQQQVFLNPINDPTKRTLKLYVKDQDSNPLNNVFVQIQMPYVSSYDFGSSDASGLEVLYPTDDTIIIIIDEDDL